MNEATETIFAEPDNGNVFLGIPGDDVTWTCNAPFSIQFFDLTGQGAVLNGEHCSDGTAFTFKVKLKQECTFFKYFVTVGKLVLDPYIGTDH